jgi:hypothetical protein
MLASPHFSQSKRYSSLLQFIVIGTLEGHADHLKERTLGVEVFGRDPSYDTAADPVVRTTAAQMRRRIAQYYFEPGHEEELVIELPPGGYTPEFRLPARQNEHTPVAAQADLIGKGQMARVHEWRRLISRHRFLAIAVVILLAASGTLAFSWFRPVRDPLALNKFWNPALEGAASLLISVGQPGRDSTAQNSSPTISESLRANSVAWPDAITASGLAALIHGHGRNYRLRKSGMTTFSDLRESPAVLVGGFNNQWIMRLGNSLRFRYVRDPASRLGYIEDRNNPSRRDWGTDFGSSFAGFDKDYGMISRVFDPASERIVVIASGIASYGTIAAGEFLTNERYMEMVDRVAPKGWERKNIQVVFSTNVISGNSGPPKILATYFW